MSDRETLIRPLEAMPLGSWNLTINGSADIWQNQDNVQKLNNNIKKIYDEIHANLPGICILKAVIFSNQFRDDVFRYQKALGCGKHLSNPIDGFVVGKTLRWGNGKIENTYAIVIHPEEIALGIMQAENSCNAAFAHELGHVFEGLYLRMLYSIDDRVIRCNQWNERSESIAQSVLGECFAQIIAFPYIGKNEYRNHVMLAVMVLKSTLDDISSEVFKYRISHDINFLWQYTLEKISFLYAQFGRSLGIVQKVSHGGQCEDSIVDDFFESLEEVDPKWRKLVERIFEILNTEEFDYKNMVTEIGVVIRDSCELLGVIPNVAHQVENGLWIDVPSR